MYQSIGSFTWSNPSHAVNRAEKMRHRAFHTVAGKHGNYRGYYRIVALSFDADAMRQIVRD